MSQETNRRINGLTKCANNARAYDTEESTDWTDESDTNEVLAVGRTSFIFYCDSSSCNNNYGAQLSFAAWPMPPSPPPLLVAHSFLLLMFQFLFHSLPFCSDRFVIFLLLIQCVSVAQSHIAICCCCRRRFSFFLFPSSSNLLFIFFFILSCRRLSYARECVCVCVVCTRSIGIYPIHSARTRSKCKYGLNWFYVFLIAVNLTTNDNKNALYNILLWLWSMNN